MALTVKANVGAAVSVASEDGNEALALTPPADVTLTVTAPEGIVPDSVSVTKDGQAVVAVSFAAGEPAEDADELVGTLAIPDEAALGTYVVTAGADSATLVLSAAETDGEQPPPADPDSVIDVAPGVYDREFALATGIAAAALSAVVVVGALVIMSGFSLDAPQATIPQGWITNTLSERIAGATQLVALAVGAVHIFLGEWLAALEVRGRLSAQVHADGAPGDRGGLADGDLGESVSKVLDSLRRARGTIATLAVGAIIILGSLWSAAHVASSSHGPEPTATQSSTPVSTAAPSPGGASPAPPPAASPAATVTVSPS
jgi:hypothetical protein